MSHYISGHGQTVAAVRDLLGLSREELAHLLGVSGASVLSWENDRRRLPAAVITELQGLQERAQAETDHLVAGYQARPEVAPVLTITADPEDMPVGWQRRIAARVAAQVPDLQVVIA